MLKDILSISGQSGLFKMISKGSNSVIVESLLNGKRFPAFTSNKIISLEDIAIFTETGEMPLKDVLRKIAEKENYLTAIDPKSTPDQLKAYFREIVPDYDHARVYVSDMKKVFQWYNTLQEKQMLNFTEEAEKAEKAEEEEKQEKQPEE